MTPWTPTEERALETYISKGLGFTEIGVLMGRTTSSVKAKAAHMQKREVRNCTPDLVSQQWDKEVALARADNG